MTESIGGQVLREQDALLKSQAWRIFSELREMQFTFAMHAANYMQLKSWSARLDGDSDEHTRQVLELWDARHRKRVESRLNETCRVLHNFLASAKMLVDHTRNHVRNRYRGHPFHSEYEQEKDKRLTSPLCKFVHQLRDYNLHYRFPIIRCTMNFDGPPDAATISSDLVINLEGIAHWDKWGPAAREFMSGFTEDPAISAVAEQYMDVITRFYLWMWERERNIWRNELREVEERAGRIEAFNRQAFPDMYDDLAESPQEG